MPKLVVSVNPEAKSSFENYEGPTPPARNQPYEGVIKNVRVKNGKDSGNPYLNVLVEHKAPADKPEDKIYDGAPQWIRVMFGDHNETEARLASFIKAVTGKANKEANIVDTDEAARSGTGSIVKTIDGVKPDGKPVKFDVRAREAQNGYPASTEGDFIRRILNAPVDAGKEEEEADEVDDEDIEVEGEEAAEENEQSREERTAELKKESLVDLKAAAAEAEIDIKGLKKLEIVEAIVAWEFDDAADEDEDSEEEDEELDVDEEEEDGEEEDGEEEDDVDPEAEIRAELAGLDRTALKVRLKEADAEAKVLKKDTDDDLRDKIVNAELGEPPF